MNRSLKEIVSYIRNNKYHLGQSLRALEESGDINSDGDVTVTKAINEVTGCRVEYTSFDKGETKGKYVLIGLAYGKSDKTLIITETGKLYLSK